MRTLLTAALIFSLTACTSEEEQRAQAAAEEKAAEQARIASYERERAAEKAKFSKIKYPPCEKTWNGDQVSKCGEQVFRIAFGECTSEGYRRIGGSPVQLDEGAGPSWQVRAGSGLKSLEKRIEDLKPDGPQFQIISYALANGTDDIRNVHCEFDDSLRLEYVSA